MPRSKKNKPNNSALKIDTCNINVQPTETTVDDEELQVRLATAKAKLQKVQEVIDKLDRLDPEKCPENKTPIDVPADTPTNISPKQTEIFSDQFLKSKVPEKNENPESLSDQIKSKKKKNRNKKNKQNENENINDNDDENIQNVEKEEVKPVQETINQDVNQSKRKPIIVDATTVVVEPVKVESNNNSKKRNKKNRNKTNTGQENVETKDSQELSQNLKTASLDDTSFKESPKLVSLEIKSETLDIPVKDEPKIVVQKENSEKLSQKKIKTEKLNSSAKKEDTKNLENDSGKLLQQEVKPEPLIDRPVKEDSKKENTDNTEKDICAVIWNILDEASFTNEAVTSTKNKKKQKGNRQPPQTEKAESIQDDKQPKELLTDGNAESQSEKPVCANKSEDDYVGNKSVTEAFANPIKKDKQQNQHNTVDTIALQNQKTTAETVSTLPAKVENIKKPNDASKSAAVEVKETLEPKLITDTEKTELKTNTNSDEKDNKSKHKHHGKKLKIQDKKGESSNPLPNLNESSIKTENTSTENIESKTVVPNDLEKQPTEILAANENKKGSTDGESITLKPDIKASDVEIKNKNLNVLEKKQTEIVPADTKQIAAYLDKDVPAGSKKKDNKNAKHNNEKNKSKSDKETADKVITAASANIVEKQDNIKQHEVTQKVNETVIKDESKTLESVAVETSQPKPEEYVKPAMEQDRTNDVKPPADSTTEKKPSVTTTNRGKPNKQTVEEKLESGNVESSQPKPKESVKPPMEQDSKTDAKNPTTESITKNKPSVTTTIKEKPNKKPAEKILESAIVEISQPKSEDLKQSGNEKGNESVAMEPTESINVETKSPVITTNKGHPSKQAPKKILDSVTVESGQQKPQESPKQTTTEIGNKPEGKRLTESALPLTNKEQPNKQTSKKTPKEIEAKLSLKSIGSETIDPSITTQKDNESEPKLPLETVTTEFTQQSSPITIQEEPSNQTSEKKGSSKHNNHKEQHQKGKQTEPKKTEPLITLPETETGTSSDNSTKTITQSTEGTAKNSQKDCEIIKKEPSLILNDWTLASNQEKGKTVKSTTGTPPVSHEEKPVKPNDNKQKPNKQKDKHNQKQAPNSPKSCAKSAEQTTKPKPIKPDNIPEGKKNDPPEPDIGKPLSLESIATGEQQPSITDEESLFDTDSKNAQGSDFAQSVEKSAKSTDEAKSLETVDQQQQPLFEQFRNDKNVSPTTNKRNKNLANAKQFEKNSSEKNTPQLAEKTAQEKMNASQTSTVQLLDILDAKMSTPEKNRLTNTGAIRKVPKDKKLQQNSPATVSHDLSSETNSKSKNQKQKSSSEIDAGIEEKLAKKLKEILSSADSENKQNSKLNLVDILASVNGLITNKTSGDKNSATKISSPPPTKAPPPVPNVFDYEDEEDFIEYKFSPRQVFVCTVCQVCKETVGKLMPCGLCRMVSYCGEKHLDEDRAVHLAFCMAIQEIAKKRGGHIYNNAKILSNDDYRCLRVHTINLCENTLKRQLQPFEREILLFPRICCLNTCREWHFEKLIECKTCGQCTYCEAHPDHLSATHSNWCKSHELYTKLVVKQKNHGRIEPSLPSKIMQKLYTMPQTIDQVFKDLYKNYNALKDECVYATLTQLATAPLTAFYGMEKSQQKIDESYTIHLVGAELQFEADTLDKWETFFLHLVPQLVELRVVFIGPELNTEKLPLEILSRIRMCRTCRQDCKVVKFDFQCDKLYHDYVKSSQFIKPDLVCFFNAGLYRSTGFNGMDTWPDTIQSAVSLKCPIVVTSYTEVESPNDLERLQKDAKQELAIIQCPIANPYTSQRPERNFISDEIAPMIFKNYYCFIIQSK